MLNISKDRESGRPLRRWAWRPTGYSGVECPYRKNSSIRSKLDTCRSKRTFKRRFSSYRTNRYERILLRGSVLVSALSLSAATAGDEGEEEGDSGGVDWATILSNPQNLAILFGLLMFILVVIYCLWKKIMACVYFVWNSFCRFPCCLTCKWCCVPCYKGTRNCVAACKNSFYDGLYDPCDKHFHPWKKMEYVTSVDDSNRFCRCC